MNLHDGAYTGEIMFFEKSTEVIAFCQHTDQHRSCGCKRHNFPSRHFCLLPYPPPLLIANKSIRPISKTMTSHHLAVRTDVRTHWIMVYLIPYDPLSIPKNSRASIARHPQT